jgi:hypothetical protein
MVHAVGALAADIRHLCSALLSNKPSNGPCFSCVVLSSNKLSNVVLMALLLSCLQSPLGKYLSEEGWPGAGVQSKEDLEKYVRTTACSGNALTGEHGWWPGLRGQFAWGAISKGLGVGIVACSCQVGLRHCSACQHVSAPLGMAKLCSWELDAP